jgi:putative Mg2+ transporter-C (MgtC) family protein
VADPGLAEIAGRIAIAAGLSAAVGLEREIHGSDAGLRTHTLVGVGAALFTLAGIDTVGGDPTRIAAQVVSGIGFIGAGAIITQRGAVRGLTTAASLWVVAAIGVGAGTGTYLAVGLSAALVILFLWPLRDVERRLFSARPHHLVVTTAPGTTVEEVRRLLDPYRPDRIGFRRQGERQVVGVRVRARGAQLDDIVTALARYPAIAAVEPGARERASELE